MDLIYLFSSPVDMPRPSDRRWWIQRVYLPCQANTVFLLLLAGHCRFLSRCCRSRQTSCRSSDILFLVSGSKKRPSPPRRDPSEPSFLRRDSPKRLTEAPSPRRLSRPYIIIGGCGCVPHNQNSLFMSIWVLFRFLI